MDIDPPASRNPLIEGLAQSIHQTAIWYDVITKARRTSTQRKRLVSHFHAIGSLSEMQAELLMQACGRGEA